VLTLNLRVCGREAGPRLAGSCPALAGLLCLAYEDTGELAGSASETLHTIMRCVFQVDIGYLGI
jgi:hypothetical protein